MAALATGELPLAALAASLTAATTLWWGVTTLAANGAAIGSIACDEGLPLGAWLDVWKCCAGSIACANRLLRIAAVRPAHIGAIGGSLIDGHASIALGLAAEFLADGFIRFAESPAPDTGVARNVVASILGILTAALHAAIGTDPRISTAVILGSGGVAALRFRQQRGWLARGGARGDGGVTPSLCTRDFLARSRSDTNAKDAAKRHILIGCCASGDFRRGQVGILAARHKLPCTIFVVHAVVLGYFAVLRLHLRALGFVRGTVPSNPRTPKPLAIILTQ